jgi:hypothetical protein
MSGRGRLALREGFGALLLATAASALTAGSVAAQTCLGLPSFESGSVHVNVSGEFPDSAKASVLGVGAGRPNNLFANAGGGVVSFEGFKEKSKLGFLEIGYQIPLSGFQLCPVAGGTIAVGPDDPIYGLTVTSRSASFGGAVGRSVDAGSTLSLIPNVAARYNYASVKVNVDDGLNPAESATTTSNSSVLDLGLALLFKERISVQPLVHVPLSGDDDDPSFGVFASFGLGWKSR